MKNYISWLVTFAIAMPIGLGVWAAEAVKKAIPAKTTSTVGMAVPEVPTLTVQGEVPIVDGYTLVQGCVSDLTVESDPRTDKSVASIGEVMYILDRLWEAGRRESQPLCFSDGFLRKTEVGWVYTPAIRIRKVQPEGVINFVQISAWDEGTFWVIKKPLASSPNK